MNALSELLNLPENERTTRGLVHTPAEIAQQPDTWRSTFELFQKQTRGDQELSGVGGFSSRPAHQTEVFLVGAGTSDYIGQSLAYLFRKTWQCEVAAVTEYRSPDAHG